MLPPLIARTTLAPGISAADGVTVAERSSPGHKVAIRPYAAGEPVTRYGQMIGFATADRRDGVVLELNEGEERMEHAESSQQARTLAEQAMQAQAAGDTNEAERLLSEAQQLDPDAVAIVLNEHDAAVAPDARDTPTANQDARRVRRMEPDTNPAV